MRHKHKRLSGDNKHDLRGRPKKLLFTVYKRLPVPIGEPLYKWLLKLAERDIAIGVRDCTPNDVMRDICERAMMLSNLPEAAQHTIEAAQYAADQYAVKESKPKAPKKISSKPKPGLIIVPPEQEYTDPRDLAAQEKFMKSLSILDKPLTDTDLQDEK